MVLFKYLESCYLNQFKEKGRVHLLSLYNCRVIEKAAIQDKFEGHTKICVEPTEKAVELSSKEAGKLFSPHEFAKGITIMPKAHVLRENVVLNALIFCASSTLDGQLMKRFNCDAYYEIVDPLQFARIVFEELRKHLPLQAYKIGKVRYADKEIYVTNTNKSEVLENISSDPWDGYFVKPQSFSVEKEVRMVFVPTLDVDIGEYRDLDCRRLLNCCRF